MPNTEHSTRGTVAPPTMKVGERLTILKGQITLQKPGALLIAISPNCRYCKASLPFYKELIQNRKDSSSKEILFVIDKQEGVALEVDMLRNVGIQNPKVLQIDFAKAKILAVPTLVALDETAQIKAFWVGELAEEGKQEVLAQL